MNYRTGIGVDVHPLITGRRLVLGGVEIPHNLGLDGNSDGDVLIHAIIDAMLGASGLGDIGQHFPADDPAYKDSSSIYLIETSVVKLAEVGWKTTYVDATILAQDPILGPHIPSMKSRISKSISLESSCVNLKATTTDKLGFIGEGKGIGGIAVATVEKLG